MKGRKRFLEKTLILFSFSLFLVGAVSLSFGASEKTAEKKPEEAVKVRAAISAFQDVFSLYIAKEKGWDKEEGLDLELIEADWPSAQELLAAGAVDFANSVEGDVIARYHQVPGLVLTDILWFFQGHGIQVRGDSEFKTYDEFIEMGYNDDEARKMALMQMKGKNIILPMKVGIEISLKAWADSVGMKYPDDFNMIDMPHAEGLAAFLGGSGDGYIGGIPQRLRGLKEGNKILIDDAAFPRAVLHCGFSTTIGYLADHSGIEVKLQKLILRVLRYCETNPDDAFPIIVREINRATGGQYTVESLKGVWNKLEYFPSSAEMLYQDAIDPEGPYYWRTRCDYVMKGYLEDGTISKPVPIEDMYQVPEVLEKLMETYEPKTYEQTFGKAREKYKNNPKEYKRIYGLDL